MSKLSYGEQLKHPNWQRKRLEALESAEFRCQGCCDGESTLHVHHKRYVKGRMAWEYELRELAVLCETCHEDAHQADDAFKSILAALNPEGPSNIQDVLALVAGWTRGYDDVPEDCAFMLAKARPRPAIAGMIARQLCESIGWTEGGSEVLMTFANCLQEPGFVAAMRETMTEVARQASESRTEGN